MTQPTDNSRLGLFGGGLFGFGLSAVLDVLVFHLIFQTHHLLSNWYDPQTVAGLQRNIYYDGLFALGMLAVALVGAGLIWWSLNQRRRLSTVTLAGTVLIGAGVFNTFDGIVDHSVLDIHNAVHGTTVWNPPWVAVSIGLLLLGGVLFWRGRRRTTAGERVD
jgi:uncharacterized membrane protein